MLFHPQRASRSCVDCQTYYYNPDETIMLRGGYHKVTRDPDSPLPCGTCPKIPKGMPADPAYAQDLSDKNQDAFQHWQEWSAVGFPQELAEDDLVRRNASIIKSAHDEYSRQPMRELTSLMGVVVPLVGRR